MKNLFRSYGLGTKEVYQQAMLEIIAKKPTTPFEREILGGNYGLSTQAMQQPETTETMETAQKIATEISEKAAKTYLQGSDKCIVWAIQEKQRLGKAVEQAFEDVITIASH